MSYGDQVALAELREWMSKGDDPAVTLLRYLIDSGPQSREFLIEGLRYAKSARAPEAILTGLEKAGFIQPVDATPNSKLEVTAQGEKLSRVAA